MKMIISKSESRFVGERLLRFMYFPPDENRLRDNAERMQQNKAPPRRPGDGYAIAGALVGFIVGIIIAGTIGSMPWMFIVGAIGGGIVGTLLGSLVGTLITKYRMSKDHLNYY